MLSSPCVLTPPMSRYSPAEFVRSIRRAAWSISSEPECSRERGSRLRAQFLHVFPLLAQHRLAVHAKPAVDEGRVHSAEIGVMLQVARVEVRETRVLAHHAALDRQIGRAHV